MADDTAGSGPLEPSRWYLVFSRDTDRRFLRWLAMGRYKHVSAVGFIPGEKLWIFVDPRIKRTVIEAVRDGKLAEARLALAFGSHDVLVLPANEPARFRLRAGLWCVPIVAHLVGVASCALRPDAFYRDCLAAGAEIIPLEGDADGHVRSAEAEDRPGATAGA